MYQDAKKSEIRIKDPLPYFSLLGTDRRMYSSAGFGSAKLLVVIFTANHCPYARAYEGRLKKLAIEFRPVGVQFISICSNDGEAYPSDNFEGMIEKSEEHSFPYPYLHDADQSVAKAFSAVCTPECFVFNQERKLCYHGWVDDNHLVPEEVTRPDLERAIRSLLNNEMPEETETPMLGCTIKWK